MQDGENQGIHVKPYKTLQKSTILIKFISEVNISPIWGVPGEDPGKGISGGGVPWLGGSPWIWDPGKGG